jgi:acyl-CoA synthetase (AMP-forming)/AMP-acid ligase II/thioesterase domain-containing protein
VNTGPLTLWALLSKGAERHAARAAILAPDRDPLNFEDLARLVECTAGQLRALGFDQRARIAVVLFNGPEMATAFLALSASCVCAPLNPASTRSDFDFALRDLGANALLIEEGDNTPAIAAAEVLGIRVLRLRKNSQAGAFDLVDPAGCDQPDWPGEESVALLLHTSGTTSKPKLVPLSARNLSTSAQHIARTLALSPEDRCLNIMPLFHIHGLMAAVLASLNSGASVVCTEAAYAGNIFGWIKDFRPTWYTAVPTMHQSILSRLEANRAVIQAAPLRFVRSSSAALPPRLLSDLEDSFQCPVIEAYGMTEAAHQMASNPLPPGRRKPGSVGLPAGPDVAIMAPSGELLTAGEIGEVVIRGPNVTAGYEANAAANAEAFSNGWFRTGDQGQMDEEGYLHLTGRFKELINRGGEKISPREVDEVLLGHPSVRQAVCFAIPHAQLGEAIGAAVEIKAGATLGSSELRAWAGERLPAFKVPRVIRVLDEIPKGPTGKLQRIGLAERIGVEPLDDSISDTTFVPARTITEERIVEIWLKLLPGRQIGVRTRFEALGGDSLLAVEMLATVSTAIGGTVPYVRFVDEGTIEALAGAIDSGHDLYEKDALTPLQPEGFLPPLYCIPGHDGALLGLARLASSLPLGQPVWVFDILKMQAPSTIEQLATQCVELLLRRDPAGPYRLAGVCFGGIVATEITRQLERRGKQVSILALIDSLNPAWKIGLPPSARASAWLRQLREKARYHRELVREPNGSGRLNYLLGRAAMFFQHHGETAGALLGLPGRNKVNRRVLLQYTPVPVTTRALVIRVLGHRPHVPSLGWQGIFTGGLISVDIPFDPDGSLAGSNLDRVAKILSERLV